MIRLKRLSETAQIPTRGTRDAAGLDLYADIKEEVIIHPGERVPISTGWAMQIPYGCAGYIFARSGKACKQGVRPSNCVGVIDPDYRGEVIVNLTCDDNDPQKVAPGERIAQLIVLHHEMMPVEEVDHLDPTERGDGGFGSTGQL